MLLLYKVYIQWSCFNCCDITTSTVPDNVKLSWYNHESDEISEANTGITLKFDTYFVSKHSNSLDVHFIEKHRHIV